MAERATTFLAVDLVEDFDFYPRHGVDATHVRNLRLALEAGETLPPMLIDQHKRILDGWHRRRAHLQKYGTAARVKCYQRTYASDLEAFEAAVEANATHARKFDEQDRSRIVLKMSSMGATLEQIAVALKTTQSRIEVLATRVAIMDGEVVAVKPVLYRDAPPSITQQQFEAQRSSSGWRTSQTLSTLIKELSNDIWDLSPRVRQLAWDLHDLIEEKIARDTAEA